MSKPDSLYILGSRVDVVTAGDAAQRILAWIGEARERDELKQPVRIVVTVNPEILMSARKNPAMARVLKAAALVVPDGIGVVMAARLSGQSLPERVPGIDLMTMLLKECRQRGLRPFFLGAKPHVIEAAAQRAQAMFPGLELAGWRDGYFHLDDREPVEQVAASGADILFTGMGADRELQWLYDHRHELKVPVAMGVGGSFDVLSGTVKRAPQWMQRCHLEWLYRLITDPKRWRRQIALPMFAVTVVAEQAAKRLGKG